MQARCPLRRYMPATSATTTIPANRDPECQRVCRFQPYSTEALSQLCAAIRLYTRVAKSIVHPVHHYGDLEKRAKVYDTQVRPEKS
jgi:hypothetical protein